MASNIIDLQARRAAKGAARDSEAPDAATLSDRECAALVAEITERLRLLGPGWRISYTG